MNIIDTHSHIYAEEFDTDRAEMMKRAQENGVRKILMPAIDSSSHPLMLTVESLFTDLCMSMMGLHPCYVKENYEQELAQVEAFFAQRKFIAVGEIGLDFYWDKTFATQQYEAFHHQIKLAIRYNVPIVIHSRNSTDECIEVISKYRNENLKGVFHCFSGNEEQANKIIELGFYLGIGGVLTFKNASLAKVLESISVENLLLETDAPYLAPMPFRGKRNEPAYLSYVLEKLATIKAIDKTIIAEVTTANAEKLFGF